MPLPSDFIVRGFLTCKLRSRDKFIFSCDPSFNNDNIALACAASFILAIEFSKAKLHTGWDTHIDGKTVKKSEEMRTQESGS